MQSVRKNIGRSMVLMLVCFSASLCAQESPAGLAGVPPVEYTRAQVLLAGGIPYVFFYAGVISLALRAKPGEYAGAYTPYTFPELFAAPYDLNKLRRLSVWLPLILCDGSLIAFNALNGTDEAVRTTEKGFIGSAEVPILLGLLATIGEESGRRRRESLVHTC